jgi:hypothetical protein
MVLAYSSEGQNALFRLASMFTLSLVLYCNTGGKD